MYYKITLLFVNLSHLNVDLHVTKNTTVVIEICVFSRGHLNTKLPQSKYLDVKIGLLFIFIRSELASLAPSYRTTLKSFGVSWTGMNLHVI